MSKKKLPLTKEVEQIAQIEITGNIIPVNWYKTILKDNGKPDLVAIQILADIVYWYKPTEIRDERTGNIQGYVRKFHGEYLQKTYKSYADMFGISEHLVKQSVKQLEKLKVIERVFKTLTVGEMTLSNVLFLKINPETLIKLNEKPSLETEIDDTYGQKMTTPMGKNCPDLYIKNDHTYGQSLPRHIQETTPETTTKITTTNIYGSSTKKQLQEERFLKFWEAYPRKVAKAVAEKSFLKLNPNDELFEKMLEALEQHKLSTQWLNHNCKYIPHASTWLNQKRWEDILEVENRITSLDDVAF